MRQLPWSFYLLEVQRGCNRTDLATWFYLGLIKPLASLSKIWIFCTDHLSFGKSDTPSPSKKTMVDLLERIDTLLEQESRLYSTKDYLKPEFQLHLQSSFDCSDNNPHNDEPSVQSSCFSTSTFSSTSSGINEVWREKICEWSYQVIDHFDFSREVVSVSIHYLDRYLATRPVNKKLFQLAAMTTLYLAIKLYEPGTLSMESMIELSRGYFQVDQMVEMELSILR